MSISVTEESSKTFVGSDKERKTVGINSCKHGYGFTCVYMRAYALPVIYHSLASF